MLLDAGADPQIGNADSWLPLHVAAANGHADAVRILARVYPGIMVIIMNC